MTTKKSIFLTEYSVDWVESISNKPKWSESVNSTIDDFRFIMEQSMPELQSKDWDLIVSTCRLSDSQSKIANNILSFFEVIDINDLCENYQQTVKKCHAMSAAEQMAVMYFVKIYWAQYPNKSLEKVQSFVIESI